MRRAWTRGLHCAQGLTRRSSAQALLRKKAQVGELELSTLDGAGSPLVVSMIGEFDLSSIAPLKDCLAAWVLEGSREAIIDLTRTDFIDSTVIGTLVTAHLAGLLLTVRG